MKLIASMGVALICAASLSAQTPAERDARAAAMRSTAAAIALECQRNADGDWDRWYAQLADFRGDILRQIELARSRQAAFKLDPDHAPNALLRADTRPPMFESPDNAGYLTVKDPAAFVTSRPSVPVFGAVSEWLKRRNIDLIVVPAPRIAEVYPDRIASNVPADKIVAPQLRRLLLDLVSAGVEVVDLLPAFLASRDAGPEPLYLLADGHWSDRAQQIAAGEIGQRLKRYDFVRAATAKPALFTTAAATAPVAGSAFAFLTPDERHQIQPFVDATRLTVVTPLAGTPFQEPADSPVVVIGDSFTHYFQLAIRAGTGIDALLSKEINIPVSNVSSAGATTGPIRDFLRRPELLRNRRVVIWIVTNTIVSYDSGWDLPPLPD